MSISIYHFNFNIFHMLWRQRHLNATSSARQQVLIIMGGNQSFGMDIIRSNRGRFWRANQMEDYFNVGGAQRKVLLRLPSPSSYHAQAPQGFFFL